MGIQLWSLITHPLITLWPTGKCTKRIRTMIKNIVT